MINAFEVFGSLETSVITPLIVEREVTLNMVLVLVRLVEASGGVHESLDTEAQHHPAISDF